MYQNMIFKTLFLNGPLMLDVSKYDIQNTFFFY